MFAPGHPGWTSRLLEGDAGNVWEFRRLVKVRVFSLQKILSRKKESPESAEESRFFTVVLDQMLPDLD